MAGAAELLMALMMSNGRVTVSGETISAAGGRCTVIFRADGTVDKNEDGSVTQIDTATDWVIPHAAALQYPWYVRFTQNSGDAFDVGTLDTWLAIGIGGSDREVGYSTSGGVSRAGNLTVEIAFGDPNNGGAVRDSGTFSLTTAPP